MQCAPSLLAAGLWSSSLMSECPTVFPVLPAGLPGSQGPAPPGSETGAAFASLPGGTRSVVGKEAGQHQRLTSLCPHLAPLQPDWVHGVSVGTVPTPRPSPCPSSQRSAYSPSGDPAPLPLETALQPAAGSGPTPGCGLHPCAPQRFVELTGGQLATWAFFLGITFCWNFVFSLLLIPRFWL